MEKRRKQKNMKKQNDELEVKPSPKKNNEQKIEKPKKVVHYSNVKNQLDSIWWRMKFWKVGIAPRKQKKEKMFSMLNTMYRTMEDLVNKVQNLKCRKNLIINQDFSTYYDEMNGLGKRLSPFEEDIFCKKAQVLAFTMLEVLIILKILQTKQQIKKKYLLWLALCNNINLSDECEKSSLLKTISKKSYLVKLGDQWWKHLQM